jgi:hypothetical protein
VLEYLYEDGLPIEHEEVQLLRASYIEPMERGVRFKIVWAPHIRPFMGEDETLQDDAGQPFTSKTAAERYEVSRLLRDYFGVTSSVAST